MGCWACGHTGNSTPLAAKFVCFCLLTVVFVSLNTEDYLAGLHTPLGVVMNDKVFLFTSPLIDLNTRRHRWTEVDFTMQVCVMQLRTIGTIRNR